MGFRERVDTILSSILRMPLSTFGTILTWSFRSAWTPSSRFFAELCLYLSLSLSPLRTLLREGWRAHGFSRAPGTIVSQVLAATSTMPLSTVGTLQRGSERTWVLPSAWATSSRVLAATFLSPFGTLLRDGWSAHVFSRARTRKYLRRRRHLKHSRP